MALIKYTDHFVEASRMVGLEGFMRGVKYRFWNPYKDQFEYIGEGFEQYAIFKGQVYEIGGYGHLEIYKVNYAKLEQYADLKDKNGREIYEGDVIYWEIDNGVGIESYTAVVRWSENLVEEGWSQTYKWLVGYTGNYYRGSYDELSTPAAYNDGLRVIGNIFENPELLQEVRHGKGKS